MPYPEDALAPHEELIVKTHPHWWYLAKAGLSLVATIIVGGWLASITRLGIVNVLVALVLLAEIGWLIERTIRWLSEYFVLTSQRVMSRSGIIAKRGIEIPLLRINTVRFEQGIFDRLLGLGTLIIESASVDGVQTFNTVRRPSDIQKDIYIQMERNDNRKSDLMGQAISGSHAAVAPESPATSIADQITQLATLRDAGHLTQAEFDQKKSELLDRM